MTKFLGLAVDPTMGGANPSDYAAPSQKAVRTYVESSKAAKCTWTELKAMVDSSTLTPGKYYRMTDFVTKCNELDDEVCQAKSAEHPFDIILLANTNNTFDEDAFAAKHEGDTYFSATDFTKWELKYSFDGDGGMYYWYTDSSVGKGVIYYMKDEFGNEAPYDFKNIQVKRQWVAEYNGWAMPATSSQSGLFAYTFSSYGDASTTAFTDYSLSGSNFVILNKISEVFNDTGVRRIPDICFFGPNSMKNSIGIQSMHGSLGQGMQFNVIGNMVSVFGMADIAVANKIGNGCTEIVLDASSSGNTFEDGCSSIEIGYGATGNTFGKGARDIMCGRGLYTSTFGEDTRGIKITKDEEGNELANYMLNLNFETGVSYVILYCGEDGSTSNFIMNYDFKRGISGAVVEATRNNSYRTTVAKKSNGDLKIYNEADVGGSEEESFDFTEATKEATCEYQMQKMCPSVTAITNDGEKIIPCVVYNHDSSGNSITATFAHDFMGTIYLS